MTTSRVVAAPGGRGVLNKVLYGEAPPRGPTPYPFIYHFGRKGTPFKKITQTAVINIVFQRIFKNALEYNVYHRCLCNFLNQTTMA